MTPQKHKENSVPRFGIIPKGAKLLSFAPYYVTKDGKTVFSMLTGKVMKQHVCVSERNKQTLKVCLRHKDGTKHWHSVHRLVASLFVVNYKISTHKTVKHRDNDVFNNSYTNLVWYAGKKGRYPKSVRLSTTGERHYGFAGWYVYGSVREGSLRQLAQALGTYPMQMTRLLKKGLIKFEPK